MSNTKHTPGTWKAKSVFLNNEPNHIMVMQDKYGAPTIADCGICLTEESQANAKLIAASPLLLDALKEVIMSDKHGHIVLDPYTKAFVNNAITAATGE